MRFKIYEKYREYYEDYLNRISNNKFSKEMNDFIINGKDEDSSKTSEEYRTEFLTNYIKENEITNKMVKLSLIKMFSYNTGEESEDINLRISGVVLDSEEFFANKNILSQNSDEKYNIELYVLTKDIKNFKDFFKEYPIDGEKYISTNDLIYEVAYHEYSMKVIAKYVLIISIIFSLFAILLLFNLIGLSITDNKKEIGVLRALGTTKKDVSKIYSIQGLLIAFSSYIISIFLLVLYSNWENNILLSGYLKKVFELKLFGVTFSTLAIMLVFSVIVVLLSTISVSLRISRMKPIDAINNK